MRLSLRAGEKIYINGAVLKADRKVSLELLNDATFLLENHVIHPEQANTPLRQLYFIVQIMLVEPSRLSAARALFDSACPKMLATFENGEVIAGLTAVDRLVCAGRYFEALKTIRSLFPVEAAIMTGTRTASEAA